MANVARKKEKSGNGFIIVLLLLRLFNAPNIFRSIDNNVITRESVAAPTERTSLLFPAEYKRAAERLDSGCRSLLDGRNKSPRQRTWII